MTPLTTQGLLDKCKRFIQEDPNSDALEELIQDALITAELEIRDIDQVAPLAWLRESYSELFTKPYAIVSAVTAASPGVITSASSDTDVTGHGFIADDIVLLGGFSGMERLNRRIFLVNYINATTFSLLELDGEVALNTTDYEDYVSGGTIYHVGSKIPVSTFQPASTTAADNWKFREPYKVTFDLYPSAPISLEEVMGSSMWTQTGGRPTRYHYMRQNYGDFTVTNTNHFLLFFQPPGQRFNIRMWFVKDYPSLATWNATTYPPHIPEIHDCIWHRALSILATNTEKQRRQAEGNSPVIATQIEVMFAQHWLQQTMQDEARIIALSRNMLGQGPGSLSGGMRG